jgi:hypothetical protein
VFRTRPPPSLVDAVGHHWPKGASTSSTTSLDP